MTEGIDVGTIAAQIHEFYRDMARLEGWFPDYPMPFPELPEHMREDNRDAARRIGRVLALAGLRLVGCVGRRWTEKERTEISQLIEQNIDLLAEGEHHGWMESRFRHGWRLGDHKDVDQRQHHLLAPYSRFLEQIERNQEYERGRGRTPKLIPGETVEKEKYKDRNSVRNYVRIIAQTQYCIAREER